jgi:hypothetical protein
MALASSSGLPLRRIGTVAISASLPSSVPVKRSPTRAESPIRRAAPGVVDLADSIVQFAEQTTPRGFKLE